MEKAKVYFSKEITPQNVVRMFKALGKELPGTDLGEREKLV